MKGKWLKRMAVAGGMSLLLATGCVLQSPEQETLTPTPTVITVTQEKIVQPVSLPISGKVLAINPTPVPTVPVETEMLPNVPTATPETEESPFGDHAVLSRITPTPTPEPDTILTPAPALTDEQIQHQMEVRYTEALVRCRHSLLTDNNVSGAFVAAFTSLSPQAMSDLERSLWRGSLGRNFYCWPYYAERLSADNASKRNWQYQARCLENINRDKNIFYEEAGDDIRRGNAHPQTINQYARMMNYVETTGDELMAMTVKPFELYLKLNYGRNYNPARIIIPELGNGNGWLLLIQPNEPQEDVSTPYERGETPLPAEWLTHRSNSYDTPDVNATLAQVEWYGFGTAFYVSGNACLRYYPQLFTGYWIPWDSESNWRNWASNNSIEQIPPVPDLEGERDLLIPDKYKQDN